jgi:hypothetical protein
MTTNWRIEKLECIVSENELTNIVYKIQCVFRLKQIINGKSYTSGERFFIIVPKPNVESFIEYENLTEAQVVEWIENNLGEERISELTTQLTEKNNRQANPTTIIFEYPFN